LGTVRKEELKDDATFGREWVWEKSAALGKIRTSNKARKENTQRERLEVVKTNAG